MTTTAATAEQLKFTSDERLELARSLVTHLESGNEDDTSKIINKLYTEKEQTMFQEIGKLTRQLHNALGNCSKDDRITSLANIDIPDARERLAYVMTKTEESAHRTLGAVEKALPLSDLLKTDACEMTAEWDRFKRREMSAEEFRKLSKKLEKFLDKVNSNSHDIHEYLSEIMMAQDFQDLTGQIISRVIGIVEEVEVGLVSVIRNSGKSEWMRSVCRSSYVSSH